MTYPQKSQITQLKLRVSCEQLNRIFYKDTLNALLVVKTQKEGFQPEIAFISQAAKEGFDPTFPEEITLYHSFQYNQRYLFQIFHNSTQKNPIGQVKLTIKELLTAPENKAVRQLSSGFKVGGRMSIQVKQVQRNSEFIYLKLRGQKLEQKSWWSWFGSHSLYFKVSRVWQNHSQSLYVSECHPHNEIIQWRQFYLQYNQKYQTEEQSRVKLQLCCLKAQNQQILAEKELEWKELRKIENFSLLDREGHPAGHFVVLNHRVEVEHSFDEFVSAGMEISLTIGIDFSASIKKHTHPDSPHYTGKGSSHYLDALIALSSFVLDYSRNKQASVYSVGAKVKHPKVYTGEKVQDCFPINGDFQNPHLQGLQGIAQTYHSILNHLQFSGPTNFRKVIEKAMGECLQNKHKRQDFSVLIILCDGKLTNIKELKQVLEGCATLPIYIIFLAIGNECSELEEVSSTKMQVFTGDKCLVERQNMINVGSYKGNKQKLHEISRKLFKNLPHVASRYMSLRKKTPQNIEKSILKKISESRKSQTHGFNPEL